MKSEYQLTEEIAEFMFDLAASEINFGRSGSFVPTWHKSTNDELKNRYRLAASTAIHVFRGTVGWEKKR